MNNVSVNPSKICVLQVLPALDMGGVERGTIELAHYLSQLGHQNFIASNGGKLIANIDFNESCHLLLPLHSKNPLQIFLNILRLMKLIKRFDINIVHARSRAPAWSAYFACLIAKIPLVTTFHGTYSLGGFLKKMYNSVMVRGQQTIAVSKYIQEHIIKNYGAYINNKDITLINRGVDLTCFADRQLILSNHQQLLQHWKIDLAYPLLIFPGRLTRWKGQLVAIEALYLLMQYGIKFKAIFLGSSQGRHNYVDEMQALIKHYHLDRAVTIDQHCPNIMAAYQLASLTVHTAIEPEAFGRVITEAQAAKCLVIASACGAPQDIIQNGLTGLLHNPGNAHDLADKIKLGLQMAAKAKQKIIDAAYRHVCLNYSNDLMFDKTVTVYKQVLQSYYD